MSVLITGAQTPDQSLAELDHASTSYKVRRLQDAGIFYYYAYATAIGFPSNMTICLSVSC